MHAKALSPEVRSSIATPCCQLITLSLSQWIVNYFSRLTTEQSFACMNEMLRVNIRENLQVVVQIATKYSDILGPVKLIEMFESFKSFEGQA